MGEVILHSDKAGVFDSLWIDPLIEDYIFERDLWVGSGTAVGGFSAANEAIGTLVLKFNDNEQLNDIMQNIHDHVKVKLKG